MDKILNEVDVFHMSAFTQLKEQQNPCSYIGLERSTGLSKYVKGPFKTITPIINTMVLNELKEVACDGFISTVDVKVLHMVPHAPNTSGTSPFMVVDNVVADDDKLHCAMLQKYSPTLKDTVTVTNWNRLRRYRHVVNTTRWDKSIYATDHVAALELVKHVLLSWAFGSCGDMAFRNFIHDKVLHKVFHVGTETLWDFSTPLSKVMVVMGSFFRRFIEYSGEVDIFFCQKILLNKDKVLEKIVASDTVKSNVRQRLEILSDKREIMQVLNDIKPAPAPTTLKRKYDVFDNFVDECIGIHQCINHYNDVVIQC